MKRILNHFRGRDAPAPAVPAETGGGPLAPWCIVAAGNPPMRIPATIRTAAYATAFVLVWMWLALAVRRYDGFIGLEIPGWARWPGLVLIAVGAALGLACGAFFAVRGHGTPAPFDPPRDLVATGPYRYVRNPMYVGGLLLLAGLGLALRSPGILALAVMAAVLSHLFVVIVEEPGLERRFGESYRQYKSSVNRWLPRGR